MSSRDVLLFELALPQLQHRRDDVAQRTGDGSERLPPEALTGCG